MATNYSDAETEDNYLETKNEDSPPISSSKSKRGREEYEKCSLEINEESKKYKKKSFHWNWTDECTVLENFYEFAGKNGSYSEEFYHFVKGKLSSEVSNSQLSDKVYRLRKRFLKDISNMELLDGKMSKFSDSNYEKLFELSSNIWGDQNPKTGHPSSSSIIQWKPEEVDRFYEKRFKIFLENIKLDITCIPPDVLQHIRKEWEDVRIARNAYQLKNAKLLVEISDIRCTQNNC